jgi:hypothetical protein
MPCMAPIELKTIAKGNLCRKYTRLHVRSRVFALSLLSRVHLACSHDSQMAWLVVDNDRLSNHARFQLGTSIIW